MRGVTCRAGFPQKPLTHSQQVSVLFPYFVLCQYYMLSKQHQEVSQTVLMGRRGTDTDRQAAEKLRQKHPANLFRYVPILRLPVTWCQPTRTASHTSASTSFN